MEKIIFEKLFENQVWKIILNDLKGNVIDSVMLRGIQEVLDEAAKEKHCIINYIPGSRKAFFLWSEWGRTY